MCFAQCRDKSHDDEARQAGEYFSDLQKKLQNFFFILSELHLRMVSQLTIKGHGDWCAVEVGGIQDLYRKTFLRW